jgi:hypothetical protein
MNLQELTGKESGIVVYAPEGQRAEAIVCNWSSVNGLPRLDPMGTGILGLGEDIPEVEGEDCDDIGSLLEDVSIIYANGEDMPTCGEIYRLPDFDATILVPEDWA